MIINGSESFGGSALAWVPADEPTSTQSAPGAVEVVITCQLIDVGGLGAVTLPMFQRDENAIYYDQSPKIRTCPNEHDNAQVLTDICVIVDRGHWAGTRGLCRCELDSTLCKMELSGWKKQKIRTYVTGGVFRYLRERFKVEGECAGIE
jgi:hypothetical protein